ncbi:MAG TPA: pitrilysin family protein [Candidatus Saccharimonadales bacterium]|nr:pitrilysin family protein [Candidatus Saccharimonadales bacterium]
MLNTLPTVKTLANGLKVAYFEFKGLESTTINLRSYAGSSAELPTELGIAHFFEHMAFEGTQKYPDSVSLRKQINSKGGNFNGATGRTDVTFYTKLLKDDVETGFDVLSQLVVHPLIPADKVDKQKSVIKQEIIRMQNSPEKYIIRLSKFLMYPKQRLEFLSTGDLPDIDRIEHKTLVEFYNRNYSANNFVLSVCGDLDTEKVFALAEKYFAEFKTGIEINLPKSVPETDFKVMVNNKSQLNKAYIYISYAGFEPFTKETYALSMLSHILGGDSSSLLFRLVREEAGLAYNISSNYTSETNFSVFSIATGVDQDKVEELIKKIKQAINIVTTELTDEESFQNLKQTIKANFIFSFEKGSVISDLYSDYLLKAPQGFNHLTNMQMLDEVSKQDILDAAKKVFSQNPQIAVISESLNDEQIKSYWLA